jgi:hypothetical protein
MHAICHKLADLHPAQVTDENEPPLFNVEDFLFPSELETQYVAE